jgi:methionyl-tRNA formyltransferase
MVKAVFFGTAEIARPSLAALHSSGFAKVIAVVSQPDRPSGRDLKLHPTPVKALAIERGIPVLQPERARSEEFLAKLRELKPDVIVVMAYGQILPASLLEIPAHGCVNIHTSILPKYRGAAPIQWAILKGDSETGVTLMKMDAGMDTGPIIAIARTPISPTDDAQTIHDRLGEIGAQLLVEKLPAYLNGSLQPTPQPEGATHARKITKEDGRLNWNEPARALWNKVRALTPWPGTYTYLPATPKPLLLKIWKADVVETTGSPGEILNISKVGLVIGTASESLRLLEVQREGAKRLPIRDFLPGAQFQVGQKLDQITPGDLPHH